MSDTTGPRTPKPLRLTIDEETIAYLESRGEVTPPSNGYRQIHSRAYSRCGSSSSEDKTRFSIVAESVETLEMAGFTREAAEEVFKWFLQIREIDNSCKLDEIAYRYIDGKAATVDAYMPGDDYRAAWAYQGMKASRYDAASDPDTEMIMFMDSASGHFKSSVESTVEYVFTMAENVREIRLWAEARRA